MSEPAEGAVRRRSPVLAAGLSIVPGLGQIYAGKVRRGLALLLGLPGQAGLFYGVAHNPDIYVRAEWLVFSWVLLSLAWLWNIVDAFLVARGTTFSAGALALLLIAVNVVAGWVVTDIHKPRLGPEQRRVMGKIVGGLASPDFLTRRARPVEATAKYRVSSRPMAPPEVEQDEKGPVIALVPRVVRAGDRIEVRGTGFVPQQPGRLVSLGGYESTIGRFRTDARGRFRASFRNPHSIEQYYFIRAEQTVEAGGWMLSKTLRDSAPRMLETIYLALMGTALSLIFALPLSFFGARNLMSGAAPLRLVYGATRTLFTILRSVEVLIFAFIAIAAVGVGPFAGVLALAVHGIGAMGKLYSEAIESIEHGPIEAIRATGASELQVVIYGVIPQVVPQFIAFTLYRWDINVRMATVIGIVGGGGIGFLLYQYIQLGQWQQAATAIWLIAGVVMAMDYASAVIREKVV